MGNSKAKSNNKKILIYFITAIVITVVILIIIVFATQKSALEKCADAGHIYSYHENGKNWGKKWPLCDHGKEQSPIDLTDEQSTVSAKLLLQGFGYQDYENVPVSKLDHTILSTLVGGYTKVDYEDEH